MIRTAPGPKNVLRANVEFAKDPLNTPLRWQREIGDIVRVVLPYAEVMTLFHPDHIEQVLVKDHKSYKKDSFTAKLQDSLGNGLVTAEGAEWKRNRRLINPGFHMARIKSYGDTMVDSTNKMLDRWDVRQQLDVHQQMSRLTLDVVARTLFGAEVPEQVATEMGTIVDFIMRDYTGVAGTGIRIPGWVPTPWNFKRKRMKTRMRTLMTDLIEQQRTKGDDGSLLSMLIAANDDQGALSDQQLMDEAITLITAGHETTASALSMTHYLLSQHPRVEARLHAEVDAIDGQLDFDSLERLPYTEAVIKESMRLYPPVWGVGREAIIDTEVGGFQVKKGTQMFLSQWATHRDPRFFPNPEAFTPDRWLDGGPDIPKLAYFPFGGGPRICIGKRFAMMEAVLLLATISRRYALRLQPGYTLDLLPSVTLRPIGGLPMTASRRQKLQSVAA